LASSTIARNTNGYADGNSYSNAGSQIVHRYANCGSDCYAKRDSDSDATTFRLPRLCLIVHRGISAGYESPPTPMIG